MGAATEEKKSTKKKSSKKKSSEDKWEQPLPSVDTEQGRHSVNDAAAAAEEEKSRRKKSSKKSREDNLEKPLPSVDAEDESHPVDDEAVAEEEKSRKKKSSKKKSRKDKWGQPISSADAEDGTHPVDDAVAAAEEEHGGEGGKEIEHEARKVVASGIPYYATEDDIRAVFEGVGPITQLQLTRFPDTGNFRGLAFVTFKTSKDATESLKLDGTEMGNRFIKVERCRVDPDRKRKREFLSDPEKVEGCHTAYIGNLSFDVTEDDIRGLFDASRIASLRFAMNKSTGKFRGFGHIDFEDDDSLEKAMSKNQAELHGRPIKIAYAASNMT